MRANPGFSWRKSKYATANQVHIQFHLLATFGPASPEKFETKLEHPSFDSMWQLCNNFDIQGRY